MKALLENVGNKLVSEIKNKFDRKGLNDTSGGKNSLKIKATDSNLQILGNDYIVFLDRGRRPGGKHPFNRQTNESYLLDWAIRRTSSMKEAKQLAFLVGRKLVREGSDIFKNKSKGLMLEEVTEMGIDLIFKFLVDDIRTKIINSING